MGEKKNKKKDFHAASEGDKSPDVSENMNEELVEEPVEDTGDSISDTDRLAEEIAELTAKNEKLNKDYLLLMADFDNYRKRTLKEKADLLKSGGEDCLKNILPIVDDFARGLMAIGESADVDAVKEGMTLIYNKFKNYLNQHGIKEIPTTGEDFNTEYHEAVTMYPAPQPELKGQVIDCVQKGYTMNDKVIRFAKVVVGE